MSTYLYLANFFHFPEATISSYVIFNTAFDLPTYPTDAYRLTYRLHHYGYREAADLFRRTNEILNLPSSRDTLLNAESEDQYVTDALRNRHTPLELVLGPPTTPLHTH